MGQFFKELKRRNVFRVAIAYGIVGWVLVQVTALAVPAFAMPGWVDTVVFYFVLIGFPVALVFAWAFELTPEGIKREEEVDRETSVTGQTGQKLNYVIGGALVLALGFIAWDKLGTPSAPGPSEALIAAADKSIAVLPFVSMSSGEDDGYFADGLTEELLNSLAQINDLKVAGRTSSFYYKGKTPNFQEVGEALGVAHVLEGSVRRSGNQLRITAQLIKVDDGFHLWSATYDRELKDIFKIQEDIAGQVTAALKVTILGEEAEALSRHGTENAEAQSLYLIATANLRESDTFGTDLVFSSGHFAPARRALERAVELDPEFAEGWAALARAYLALETPIPSATSEGLAPEEARLLADAAADRAMALAPDLPKVLHAKALSLRSVLLMKGEADVGPAFDLLKRALVLAPGNIDILGSMANFRVRFDNDYEGGIALYDRALAVDPLSSLRLLRADAVRFAGRAEEARREYLKVGQLYPDAPWKAGIAEIEYDRGHLHHLIIWLAGVPDNEYPAFAWASLRDLDKALEIERDFARVGGQLGTHIEVGMHQFKRDYQGILDHLNGSPDVLAALGPEYVWRWRYFAASYLRDWPAAIALWDERVLANAGEAGDWSGTPEGRARVRGLSPFSQMRFSYHAAWTAGIHRMAGRRKEADAIWDWALELADMDAPQTPRFVQDRHVLRALVHAGRGEKEEALDELEQAYEAGWRWLMGAKTVSDSAGDWGWIEDNPVLDSIRDEPRFIAFIDKVEADNARMLAELEAGLTLEDIIDEE